MTEIVTLLLPFFGLLLLGYGSGRLGYLGHESAAGLEFLLRYIALPAFFFQAITQAPSAEPEVVVFAAMTTFSTYCAFAVAFSIGALLNGGNVPEATVQGLAGSNSNVAYLAPALVLAAFGPAAALPAALILSLDYALLCVVTPLMMALGGTARARPVVIAEQIGRAIAFHPIVLATVLGILFTALGWRLPGPIDAVVGFARQLAAPGALFAFGLAISFVRLGPLTIEMPAVVIVKLLIQPLIVYLLLSWIGGFDPVWVNTAILLAALPPAVAVIATAEHYRVYAPQAGTIVIVATVGAAVTVTILLTLLVNGMLPADPFR